MRRWSWVAELVVGLVLFEAVRRTLIGTGNPNLVPALILLGSAVVPVAFVDFMAQRRLRFGVDGRTIGLVALFGGVVGVVAAGMLEYDTLRDLGFVPLLAVGLIEEAAKLVVPAVLLLAMRRHVGPADGLVVGVASGAGFAVLETMGYAFVTLIQSGGDLAAVVGVLLLRGLLSPAAHMAWTGLAAAALWNAAANGRRPRLLGRFVAVYLLVVALHAAWDSSDGLVGYTLVAAISLGLLAFTTWRLGERAPHGGPAARTTGRREAAALRSLER